MGSAGKEQQEDPASAKAMQDQEEELFEDNLEEEIQEHEEVNLDESVAGVRPSRVTVEEVQDNTADEFANALLSVPIEEAVQLNPELGRIPDTEAGTTVIQARNSPSTNSTSSSL